MLYIHARVRHNADKNRVFLHLAVVGPTASIFGCRLLRDDGAWLRGAI